MYYDHFLQSVIGRCIGGCGGQHFDKGVVGSTDDGAVLLPRIRIVYFELLVLWIVDDERFAIEAVHGGVGVEGQFFLHAEFLTAVGMQSVGLRQLAETCLGCGLCGEGHGQEQGKHTYV